MNNYCLEFGSMLSLIKNMDITKIFDKDVSTPEFVMLSLIDYLLDKKHGEPVWVSDIVENTAVTAQAVSKQLRGLEQKGYLMRFTDSKDRRRTEVRVSSEGKKMYDALKERHEQFMDNIISGFEGNEYAELLRLTRKFQILYTENVLKMSADKK